MSAHDVIVTTRPIPFGVPIVFAVLVAALAWADTTGDVSEYFRYQTPQGQTLYVFSKLAGLVAGTLLTTHIVLILLKNTTLFGARFAWTPQRHMALGLLTILILLAHVALYIAAVSMRGDAIPMDLLFPVFGHNTYRTGLSLGSIGLITLAVCIPFGVFVHRARLPATAKKIHRLGVAALALGIAHALVIGSEKSTIIALAICAVIVILVIAYRWSSAMAKP